MFDVLYRTPEGQSQIIYVWHLKSGSPLFALPRGDHIDLQVNLPDRLILELGENFEDYDSRLSTIAQILTGKNLPSQFVDGHTGQILASCQ